MSLSSNEIQSLIKALDKSGLHGHVAASKRVGRMSNPAGGVNVDHAGNGPTRAQAQFLNDLDAMPRTDMPKVNVHPRDMLGAQSQEPDGLGGVRTTKSALTESDRMCLQRLPLDPKAITFDDARQILALQQSVSDKSDKRLIDSIANPVSDYHDNVIAAQAVNAADYAARNRRAIPASALPALADAIGSEVPQLQPDEAASRAADVIDDLAMQRNVAAEQRVDAAHERVRMLAAAKADRTTMTRQN